jgi:hypothetical protein
VQINDAPTTTNISSSVNYFKNDVSEYSAYECVNGSAHGAGLCFSKRHEVLLTENALFTGAAFSLFGVTCRSWLAGNLGLLARVVRRPAPAGFATSPDATVENAPVHEFS